MRHEVSRSFAEAFDTQQKPTWVLLAILAPLGHAGTYLNGHMFSRADSARTCPDMCLLMPCVLQDSPGNV
eukprot:15460188-Alexandrium_andersonii.AAC.1